MLTDARLEFELVDLALPQHRAARTQVGRVLRQKSRSELDVLSLPLLLRGHDSGEFEVLLVSDERPEVGWPRR